MAPQRLRSEEHFVLFRKMRANNVTSAHMLAFWFTRPWKGFQIQLLHSKQHQHESISFSWFRLEYLISSLSKIFSEYIYFSPLEIFRNRNTDFDAILRYVFSPFQLESLQKKSQNTLVLVSAVVNCTKILRAPFNGFMAGKAISYLSERAFWCQRGFQLRGSRRRVCQANKQWNGRPTTCSGRFDSLFWAKISPNCVNTHFNHSLENWNLFFILPPLFHLLLTSFSSASFAFNFLPAIPSFLFTFDRWEQI